MARTRLDKSIIATVNASALFCTATNDSATAGYIGEYITATASNQSYPATGNYGDGASISLTAGDWDVSAVLYTDANGATMTLTQIGISTTSGNSATGLTFGDNTNRLNSNISESGICIPAWRVTLTGTTIHYCKVRATYTVATPKYYVRISARRVR